MPLIGGERAPARERGKAAARLSPSVIATRAGEKGEGGSFFFPEKEKEEDRALSDLPRKGGGIFLEQRKASFYHACIPEEEALSLNAEKGERLAAWP